MTQIWEDRRRKLLGQLQGIEFDTTMAIGLPWLARVTDLPYVSIQDTDRRLGDVNLLFQPRSGGARPLGISFCNQPPRLLWHRLDRLKKQWEAARNQDLRCLVMLRFAEEPTTPASKSRLDTLDKPASTWFSLNDNN